MPVYGMMQVVAEAHVAMVQANLWASHVGAAPYHHAVNAAQVCGTFHMQ